MYGQLMCFHWNRQSLLYCAGINSFATLYGARSTDAENERAAGITSAVYNNMAACYLRQSKWEKAIYAATKALALAPENLKALYRRAEAYLELGRNQLAARETLMLRSTGDHKVSSRFSLAVRMYTDGCRISFD